MQQVRTLLRVADAAGDADEARLRLCNGERNAAVGDGGTTTRDAAGPTRYILDRATGTFQTVEPTRYAVDPTTRCSVEPIQLRRSRFRFNVHDRINYCRRDRSRDRGGDGGKSIRQCVIGDGGTTRYTVGPMH